ncbi:MAG TPA: cyanophycinase [Gemmatimonadales bacterium]
MTALRRLAAAALLAAAACAPQAPVATGAPAAPAAPAPSSVGTAARTEGSLLIVGGGPIPGTLLQRFVDLAGGAGRARIVVFPTASAVESSGPDMVARLEALGADAVSVRPTREEAMREESARLLDGATGVWFTGGDQNRITATMGGTPLARALEARYRAGTVVGGTSAGAAIMSARMITGEEQRPGGARPVDDDGWMTIESDNIEVAPGLGLLRGAVVDQHFVRRKRHNRLLSVVLEHPERLGVGIDESTAIEVAPDGRWTVRGASVALVYDARGARVAPADSTHTLAATGVVLHLLPAGATFDPATGEARLP